MQVIGAGSSASAYAGVCPLTAARGWSRHVILEVWGCALHTEASYQLLWTTFMCHATYYIGIHVRALKGSFPRHIILNLSNRQVDNLTGLAEHLFELGYGKQLARFFVNYFKGRRNAKNAGIKEAAESKGQTPNMRLRLA